MAEAEESTLDIPMRDGHQHEAVVCKPKNNNELTKKNPLIVIIHGGGFAMGDIKDQVAYARALPSLYNVTVVNVTHRLAPQYKFPIPVNDVVDTLKWLGSNAPTALGVDLTAGFIVGGISSGANLAVVATHRSILEKWEPKITGLMLTVPLLLHQDMVPAKYKPLFLSREENADGMILNAESLRLIFQTYEPDVHSSDFSPFNLKDTAEVGKMPPVYIQISGKDPLRDDGIIYEKFLREHRVKTKLDVYEELSHGEYVIGNSEATWRANCGVFNGFGWLLGKEAKTDADIAKVFSQPALACTMPEGIHLGLSIPDHLVSAK